MTIKSWESRTTPNTTLGEQLVLMQAEINDLRAAIQEAESVEPVAFQFQGCDGEWHPFINQQHYTNTVADGLCPIRALYIAPPEAQSALRSHPMFPPQGFVDYVEANYRGEVVFKGAEWHAKRLWNAAMKNYKSAQSAKPLPFEMEWPAYHEQAMGCGLEDRDITDRYEAMRYGWDQALEHVEERLPGVLYIAPQPAPQVPSVFKEHSC